MQGKTIYDFQYENQQFHGEIKPRDLARYKFTSKYIDKEVKSILDVGCFCGEWLNYITQKRIFQNNLGIDVSPKKIEQAQQLYPHLAFQACEAEKLSIENKYDVVTCLETLEHIPDWKDVFLSLFGLASKQVLISVPYRETIYKHICIHCGKPTPSYGHLHSFSEDSFEDKSGYIKTIHKIPDLDPLRSFAYRLYRRFNPNWMLVDYRCEVNI